MSKFYTEDADFLGVISLSAMEKKQTMDTCNGDVTPAIENDIINTESSEEDEENVYDSLSVSDDDFLEENVVSEDEKENTIQKDSNVVEVLLTKAEGDDDVTVASTLSFDKDVSDYSDGKDVDESEEDDADEEAVIIRQRVSIV